MPSPRGSLREVNERIHQAVDDALVDHLVALTALDLATAEVAWRRMGRLMVAHADIEDATALARYTALGEYPPGASPALLEAEHRHLRRLHVKVGGQLDEFHTDDPDLRRTVILALDRYLLLRHLWDHHTRREQNAMYPRLEAVLTPEEQAELRETLSRAHEAAQNTPFTAE